MRYKLHIVSLMTGLLVSVFCLPRSVAADDTSDSPTEPNTHRRRIIISDDGEVGVGPRVLKPTVFRYVPTPEDVPTVRFDKTVGTQVDTYILNIAATDRGPMEQDTPITHVQSSMAQFYYWGDYGEIHPDTEKATRILIRSAREAGMEIIASIRVNDSHDAPTPGASKLHYPLKREHPELLLGSGQILEKGGWSYGEDTIMGWYWSGLNFAKPEVPQHFLKFIAAYCPEYDFDGLELDFYRHPRFFRFGEERQNLETMSDFVRQVRQILNQIGEARGRPYLLAVRIPETPAWARRCGLDVQQWLEEDLLDMVTLGGGYMAYSARMKEFIDLGHRHEVPVYGCINKLNDMQKVRTLASNFWALGADGVYVFNWGIAKRPPFPDPVEQRRCLQQIGNPETLLGLDKRYLPANGEGPKGWRGTINRPPWFPIRLADGDPIELVVGDDVRKASVEGILDEIHMTVNVDNMELTEGIRIEINDVALAAQQIERTAKDRFEAVVTAPPLSRGINEIVVLPGAGSTGRLASTVTSLELSVRYTQLARSPVSR